MAYEDYLVTPEQASYWQSASAIYNGFGQNWSAEFLVNINEIASNLPGSAFDITTDNAARHQVASCVGNPNNWGFINPISGIAHALQDFAGRANQFVTGSYYTISFQIVFSDQSTAKFEFRSENNSIVFIEVRDSSGNLIATNSPTPTLVDYGPTYHAPGANELPDYENAINWFLQNGIPVFTGEPMIARVDIGGVTRVP